MSLQTRVKVLESGSGGLECPECEWDGTTPLKPIIEERGDGAPEGNTYCGMCGRPILITLTWGDDR